jgi:hypothetical protein
MMIRVVWCMRGADPVLCIGEAAIVHDGSVAATAAAVGSISMQTGLSIGGAHQPRRSRSELASKGAGEVQLPQVGIANESDQVT